MGYRKIINLYKNEVAENILSLDEVYALEKIHGTSANVSISADNSVEIFPGGVKLCNLEQVFIEKFDSLVVFFMKLKEQFDSLPLLMGVESATKFTVFGEAYGGKCQKMSKVYGPLNFVAFEVLVEYSDKKVWLTVPEAEAFVLACGLEFVHYERGPATIEWLNTQRDKPSTQAVRNGMGEHTGEGIVVRPIKEMTDRYGRRVMAKHKTEKMSEVRTPRVIDPTKLRMYDEANVVANEFVTAMRLQHVLDKLKADGHEVSMKLTGTVVRAVIDDVQVEEGDEIAWSPVIAKAVGRRAAKLFKEHMSV